MPTQGTRSRTTSERAAEVIAMELSKILQFSHRSGHEHTTGGWALMLTGGANWGAVQVGAARALFERGFQPELIVGVSVGSVNGAYLAARPTLDGVDELTSIWEDIDARTVYGSRLPGVHELAAFVLGRPAAFSNEPLRKLLTTALPVRRFEETSVPLITVATHLESGSTRLLASGDLVSAVLASSAIPGVFPPVERDGESLVDGAVADPVPFDAVEQRGLDRVAVVESGRSSGRAPEPHGALGVFQWAMTVMRQDRMDLLMQSHPAGLEVVRLGAIRHPDTSIADFSSPRESMGLAYREAAAVLDSEGWDWREADVPVDVAS